MRPPKRHRAALREPHMAEPALLDELRERLHGLLDRDVRRDARALEEVELLRPCERLVDRVDAAPEVLGAGERVRSRDYGWGGGVVLTSRRGRERGLGSRPDCTGKSASSQRYTLLTESAHFDRQEGLVGVLWVLVEEPRDKLEVRGAEVVRVELAFRRGLRIKLV